MGRKKKEKPISVITVLDELDMVGYDDRFFIDEEEYVIHNVGTLILELSLHDCPFDKDNVIKVLGDMCKSFELGNQNQNQVSYDCYLTQISDTEGNVKRYKTLDFSNSWYSELAEKAKNKKELAKGLVQ